MSTKVICDACGRESKDEFLPNWRNVEYPIHLQGAESGEPVTMGAYVDPENNAVSGRMFSLDFCPKCYNEVTTASLTAVAAIRTRLRQVP